MYEIYRHYRGNHYLSLGSALHSETLEQHTVYRSLYDNPKSKFWVRPREMFEGNLESGERRFTRVARVGQVVLAEDAHLASQAGGPSSGVAWVIEDTEGSQISCLNLIRFSRQLACFASITTEQIHREKGFEALLIAAARELTLLEEPTVRFLLLSEGRGSSYEQLGFRLLAGTALNSKYALVMITGDEPLSEREQKLLAGYR